jgi:VWFA-related protein
VTSASFMLRPRVLLMAMLASAASLLQAQQESALAQTQQKPESGGLVIHEDVRRVIVDVVVTDANGKPVPGLTRDEFSIAEDGKPQRVLSFDVHDFDPQDALPAELPPLPPNTFMNIPRKQERGPLYVILYDMLNMTMDDQGTARKQLLRFISAKPTGVRFAIFVLSDGLRLVQGFTDDPYELFAALDPKSPRAHVPKIFLYGENYGQGQINYICWTLTQIAKFLDGFPGRKNVMWVTGSLVSSILPTADRNTEAVNYNDEIKEAIDAMARSQIAVYPLDVRGVVPGHIMANPGGVASSDSAELKASYSTDDDLAIATGGHAFYSSNGLGEALAEATVAGGNYYTLTYAPSNQRYDGQLRNIRVNLPQAGYRLAYRRFYFGGNSDSASRHKNSASDPAQKEDAKPRDSLFTNMQHGAPMAHQIVFKAHVCALGAPAQATPEQMLNLSHQQPRRDGKNRPAKSSSLVRLQAYAIDYALPAQQLKPQSPAEGRPPFLLEMAAAAFDGDGQMLVSKVEHARDTLPTSPSNAGKDATGTTGFYRAQQQIAVPLNATSIRLAVKDVSTDRVGTIELTLPLAAEPQTQAASPVMSRQPSATGAFPGKPN